MTDKTKRFVSALRARCAEQADCNACPIYKYCIHDGMHTMHNEAADLIESLAAELEQVKQERDGLQMELDELKEEYYTDIHTARDPMLDKIKQLERERDAAVEDLRGACAFCAHVRECLVTGCTVDMGEACKQCPCETCFHDCNWQWRGVKED